jgi:hypothetical protein
LDFLWRLLTFSYFCGGIFFAFYYLGIPSPLLYLDLFKRKSADPDEQWKKIIAVLAIGFECIGIMQWVIDGYRCGERAMTFLAIAGAFFVLLLPTLMLLYRSAIQLPPMRLSNLPGKPLAKIIASSICLGTMLALLPMAILGMNLPNLYLYNHR